MLPETSLFAVVFCEVPVPDDVPEEAAMLSDAGGGVVLSLPQAEIKRQKAKSTRTVSKMRFIETTFL